ncbi:MAG TPA: hypothetical protein VIJ22_11800 [Polyangiaceae bacterium]
MFDRNAPSSQLVFAELEKDGVRGSLHRYATSRTGDEDDAKDLVAKLARLPVRTETAREVAGKRRYVPPPDPLPRPSRDPATDALIAADKAEFQAAGGFALPTLWVGEVQLVGAQPQERIEGAVAGAMARAGS